MYLRCVSPFFSDITQNRGFGYSATILPVATKVSAPCRPSATGALDGPRHSPVGAKTACSAGWWVFDLFKAGTPTD